MVKYIRRNTLDAEQNRANIEERSANRVVHMKQVWPSVRGLSEQVRERYPRASNLDRRARRSSSTGTNNSPQQQQQPRAWKSNDLHYPRSFFLPMETRVESFAPRLTISIVLGLGQRPNARDPGGNPLFRRLFTRDAVSRERKDDFSSFPNCNLMDWKQSSRLDESDAFVFLQEM